MIRFIISWSWTISVIILFMFSSHLKWFSITSKILFKFIITWSWLLLFILWYYIYSISFRNCMLWWLITRLVIYSIILSWTWTIFSRYIISFTLNSIWYTIFTKFIYIILIIIISWTWHIFSMFRYNIISLWFTN